MAIICDQGRSPVFSPVISAVREYAAEGGPVVGICNGFQVLTEAHLLPGALQKNKGLTFLCQMTGARGSERSLGCDGGGRARPTPFVPINHFDGNYTAEPDTLQMLEDGGRIVLRYVAPMANPNGSVRDIAGVCNESGNVVGLMPHPERASSELLGSSDGLVLLRALLSWAGARLEPAVGR